MPTPSRLRSMYGIVNMNPIQIVGTMTPARPLSMWCSSSWRFSRYHGAFDGFGVRSGFEWSWSGALNSAASTNSAMNQSIATMNSMTSRCGHTIAVSSTRLSTRTTESCRTKASSRRRFSWPGNGCGPRWRVIPGRSSLGSSERPRDPAVLPDAPEVDGDQEGGRERQGHDVEDVEPQQGVRTQLVAAEEDEGDLVADERRRARDLVADRDGPERELVPREQVARVRQQQREHEEQRADDPVELARRLVRAGVEDPDHVQEHGDDHAVGGPAVHVAQELAEDDHGLEILHVRVGPLRRGAVIEHQERPGEREQEEEEEREPSHAPRVGDGERVAAHLDGVKMQEDVREDRERLVLARVGVAVTEERTPDGALLEAIPELQRDVEHR